MRHIASIAALAFTLTAATVTATTPTDGTASEPAEPPEPAPADPLRAELGSGRIVTGTTAHRTLHFTFDDGPSRAHTRHLLDELDRRGVRATFFLVAHRLEHPADRALAREIAERGHTIGLHSYDHDRLDGRTAAELAADLDASEALFTETFGARPVLFRPPYGHHDDTLDVVLASRGYTEVLWNLHGGDVTARTADQVVETFRSMLDRGERDPRGAGGVVLLHDTHGWTLEAFPRIMDEIDARNCAALANGEELWDVAPDLSAWHQARGRASATRRATRMHLDEAAFAARQEALRVETEVRCGR